MKILDTYFRAPILWDCFCSIIFILLTTFLINRGILNIPNEDDLKSLISDLSTIALTLAGFILTLLTVLISFKSSSKVQKNNIKETDSVFEIFFASDLYFATIKILKSAIISLTLIALLGYILKLFLDKTQIKIFFYYCIVALTITFMTIWRSLLILSRIIKIQQS